MRENKFRGKRKDNGEWVNGYGVIVGEHYGRIYGEEREASIFVEYDKVSRLNFQLVDVDPETVGQYSNYYDIKFYDGDIISVDCDCDSEYGCYHLAGRYLVVWNEETAGYALKNLNNRIFYALDNFGEENMHNIGNRWDNPDLLEV